MTRLWTLTDYIERLSHPSGFVRKWAFKAIEEFYPRLYVKEVANLIGDSVEHLACAAPKYLARHNGIEFAPAILECFKKSSDMIAGNCIEALEMMNYQDGYDTVLEKYPHIRSLNEFLGVIGYLGIIKTEESHQLLRSAFKQFQREYYIGGIAGSLLAHGNPADIEWIIDLILQKDQVGLELDGLFKSIAHSVSAFELYRDLAGDYGKLDIFEKPKQVLQELVQYNALISDQGKIASEIAAQIGQQQYDNLISTLMFEAKRIVQARVSDVPSYQGEIKDIDYMALNILEGFAKHHLTVKKIKSKKEKGAKLLSSIVAVYFSVIGRGGVIETLNPESSIAELIRCLRGAGKKFPEPIKKRLIEIEPIDVLKSTLTKELNTWGDIWVVRLMGKIGNPAFIPELIRVVNETEPISFIYGDAIHAIQCIDDDGHPDIFKAIRSGEISDSGAVMSIVKAFPYSESFDIAHQLWNAEDDESAVDSCEMYAYTLAGIGDIRGIKALQDILYEGNALFIGNAIETLCHLHEKEIPELSMIHKEREAQRKRQEKRRKELSSLGRRIGDNQLEDSMSDFPQSKVITFKRNKPKVGRNSPCPCGSGKKYKKCCLQK